MKTKSGVAFLVGLLVLCGLFSCANSVLDPALPDGVTDGDLDNADVELILVDGDADNDTERADLEAAETDAETDGPEAETSTDGDPERDAEPEAESSEADAEPDSDGESAAETDADTESEAPLLPFGEICTTSENCAAGLTCMTVLGTLRCSKSCADEGSLCPEGGECIDLTSRKTTVLKVCAKSDSIHQNTYMAACRGDWGLRREPRLPAGLGPLQQALHRKRRVSERQQPGPQPLRRSRGPHPARHAQNRRPLLPQTSRRRLSRRGRSVPGQRPMHQPDLSARPDGGRLLQNLHRQQHLPERPAELHSRHLPDRYRPLSPQR